MRIAIITPEAPAHHKHFCAYLARRHDVVAVVHPSPSRSDIGAKGRRLRRQVADTGLTYTAIRALGSIRTPLMGWDWIRALEEAEDSFFPDAETAYSESVSPVAQAIADVNSDAGIRLIRQIDADVVVCLGGPIYRPPLIAACRSMINFHSGISPVYNGASTIMFAFANGHFQLCGGTLMTMSPVVDGGDILMHYLPALETNDTPATIFMKTVAAAPEVVDRFLVGVERRGTFAKAPQPPPLFRCISASWTVHHTHQVRLHLERRAIAPYIRPEQTIDYAASTSDAEAGERVAASVARLLGWA